MFWLVYGGGWWYVGVGFGYGCWVVIGVGVKYGGRLCCCYCVKFCGGKGLYFVYVCVVCVLLVYVVKGGCGNLVFEM